MKISIIFKNGVKKAVKLEKEVIIVRNSACTTSLYKKNAHFVCIFKEISVLSLHKKVSVKNLSRFTILEKYIRGQFENVHLVSAVPILRSTKILRNERETKVLRSSRMTQWSLDKSASGGISFDRQTGKNVAFFKAFKVSDFDFEFDLVNQLVNLIKNAASKVSDLDLVNFVSHKVVKNICPWCECIGLWYKCKHDESYVLKNLQKEILKASDILKVLNNCVNISS